MKSRNKFATVVAAATLFGGCGSDVDPQIQDRSDDSRAKRYFVLDDELRNIPIDTSPAEPQSGSEKKQISLQVVKDGGKLTLQLMGAMDEADPQIDVPPILVKDGDYISTDNERLAKEYGEKGFNPLKVSVPLSADQKLFAMGLPGEDINYIGVKSGPNDSAYVTLTDSAESIDGPIDLRVAPVREDLNK